MDEMLRDAMDGLRGALQGERSAELRKRQLMAEFDRVRRPARRPWFAAIAAALFLTICAGTLSKVRPPAAPEPEEESQVAEEFTPIPYAPPVEEGEWVEVVRTELDEAALMAMGVEAPFEFGEVEADILLGEDGVPRAVRLIGGLS